MCQPWLTDCLAPAAGAAAADRLAGQGSAGIYQLRKLCGTGPALQGVRAARRHELHQQHTEALRQSAEQQAMLDLYTANAKKFSVTSETVLGQWPAVADVTPVADVVTVFHVAYNVGEILPFLEALNSHARKRVVIEVPVIHPMSNMNEGWKHFWNLIRPTVPAASDLITVLDEMGIKATIEYFESEILLDKKVDGANGFIRRRLCLPEERQGEVDAFIAENPMPERRKLAVIWWDIQ